jgi:hypothetical protein
MNVRPFEEKTTMQVLYADGHSMHQGGPVGLVMLNGIWHVVARGYLCRVTDQEEGRQVIAGLKASRPPGPAPNDPA